MPEKESDLERFRQQARSILRRPFKFEPREKEIIPVWQETSADPFVSFFKPFSQVVQAETVSEMAAEVRSEINRFSLRQLSVPIAISVLLLVVLAVWQLFLTSSSDLGVVSPVPGPVGVQNVTPAEEVPVSSETITPGTELQPGGPYTGTGGYEPPPANSTNLNDNSQSNVGSPPDPTCPSGKVCSGQALDGSDCTVDVPCTLILVSGLATGTITTGINNLGQPCTTINPCILVH